MSLTVAIEQDGDVTVASLRGEMDGDNCGRLSEALAAQPRTGPLIVDLAGLTFIDSAGITQLVQVRSACVERNAPFTVRATPPGVRRILEITGMLEHFGIE